MIEEKTQGSVWSIAMLAVFLFLAAISFDGVFSDSKSPVIAASATK